MKSISLREFLCEFIAAIIFLSIFGFFVGTLYSISKWQSPLELTLAEWQQISTVSLGTLGVALGYLYFKFKIKVDDINGKKERIRKRLFLINEELTIVDQLIEKILTIHIKSNSIHNDFELKIIRENISKRLLLLSNTYLENNNELIGFSKIELDNIINLHSYFENSDILSKKEYNALIQQDLLAERYKYNDVFSSAAVTCILKLEDL